MAKYLALIVLESEEQARALNGPVTIRGLFRLPQSHCKCPDAQRKQLKNWAKAKRFGIPTCRTCKRPSPVWVEGIHARLTWALGNNLMEED